RDDELVHALRLREVLETMFSEIAEGDAVVEVLTGERRGRTRQQHLTAVRDVRDTRGPMNIDPDVIRAGLAARRRALPGMHAHADPNDGVVREAGRSESALR